MRLRGEFAPPGDKSISHRLGLVSLLAEGECRVTNYASGQDCQTTLAVVRALGGQAEERAGEVVLGGAGGRLVSRAELDCRNSGTTFRLLLGLLAGQAGEYRLDGDASLRQRPMERVAAPLRAMGATVATSQGRPPALVRGGGLRGLDYRLPVASAQVKSALLLAGLRAQGASTVREDHPTRDHTERLLSLCGADLAVFSGGVTVRPGPLRLPAAFPVPGDPSSAAFFLATACVLPESLVLARGLLLNPGRIGFLAVLGRMGARLEIIPGGESPEPWGEVRAAHTPELVPCLVTPAEVPDLIDEVPILALVATQARGTSWFKGVGELRVKESDRLAAIVAGLGAMGARLGVAGDDLWVEGPVRLEPAPGLNPAGDHRMAMTLALAHLLAGAPPEVPDLACAAVSYPGFAAELERLLA